VKSPVRHTVLQFKATSPFFNYNNHLTI